MKLSKLEPQALWNHFLNICSIPHPSGHLEAISDYVKECAEKGGLRTRVDGSGNILVSKPPTAGLENVPVITLQSHLDMVPQKNQGTDHDFLTQPIRPLIEGEWVKAQGTTLGADNGIGVAAALAFLEDKALTHGPVEALFTTDEETGMYGAIGLQDNFLMGDILLNLDTEQQAEICIGCAGGEEAGVVMPLIREPVKPDYSHVKVSLRGLKGGHSGLDIDLGRANALKLMGLLLSGAADTFQLSVTDMSGGTVPNAIPREAFCLVALPKSVVKSFVQYCSDFQKAISQKYAETDPGIAITVNDVQGNAMVMESTTQQSFLRSLNDCPNGVIAKSKNLNGVVETSLNLSLVTTEEKSAQFHLLLRSSSESARKELGVRLEKVFARSGGQVNLSGGYPGWQPDPQSRIVKLMKQSYQSLFNRELKVEVVHAGLECGIIGAKYPAMELVSFGPTIRFPHSPDEAVHIESVGKFWRLLVHTVSMVGGIEG